MPSTWALAPREVGRARTPAGRRGPDSWSEPFASRIVLARPARPEAGVPDTVGEFRGVQAGYPPTCRS